MMRDKKKARDLYNEIFACIESGVVTQREMIPILEEIKEYFDFDKGLFLYIKDIIHKIKFGEGASWTEMDTVRGLLHDECENPEECPHTSDLREAIRMKYLGKPSKLEEFL